MKRSKLKIILFALLIFTSTIIFMHIIGSFYNRRTPKGGINESMYLEINGTKEWINIYGKDKNNPVLLYLHGGPGSATSEIDYAFTRKWADIYTIVTLDQRNCGKSYNKNQNDLSLTKEMFMRDGKELTEYIRNYLKVDKITILGHSWGSMYGANLIHEYPEYYDLFIGVGQLIDPVSNEKAFIEEAKIWAKADEESLKLLKEINPENINLDFIKAKNAILDKYGYSIMKDGTDYFLPATILFNPNYSLKDWFNYFKRDRSIYLDFFRSNEYKAFSLENKYSYDVPYIIIIGDMDYQVNYKLAEEYYNKIKAPQKDLYIMKNTSHGLMVSKSNEFSDLLHLIFKKYKWVYE